MKISTRTKAKIYIALHKFIFVELWQYLLVFTVLGICAWLFQKPIEAIMFCIAHTTIRPFCDKEFHCNTTGCCLALTFSIIALATLTVLPLSVSLLSAVPLALFTVYFGYLIQSAIDDEIIITKLQKYINELLCSIRHKDIYAMSETELYEHCKSCGLDDLDSQIAKLIVIDRLKGQELYAAIGYSERQTKRKRKTIINKIQ